MPSLSLLEAGLGRLPEHNTLGDNASGSEAPKRNEQLSGKRDDHRRLASTFRAGCTPHVPSCQSAILLEGKKPPSELNEAAPHTGIARFSEALLSTLRTALIGCTG